MFAVLLTIGCTSCMTSPSTDCAWVRRITLAPEDSLSRATLEQIAAHNLKVQAFCRKD
jgi:hypothetical protein